MQKLRTYTMSGYSRLVGDIIENGERVDGTLEVRGFAFKMKDPRARVVKSKARKINFPFAILEWLDTTLGYDDIEPYTFFIKHYSRFSKDDESLDGAYGPRIASGDQLRQVIKLLQQNPQSRRAVVTINNGAIDLIDPMYALNTPCTLNLQYMIRNNRLHATTFMRSNDVHLGIPYDVFNFTMIQEFLAVQLGVPIGDYIHFSASTHAYESFRPQMDAVVSAGRDFSESMYRMPIDTKFYDLEKTREYIMTIVSGGDPVATAIAARESRLAKYWSNLIYSTASWALRKKDPVSAEHMAVRITSPLIRKVTRNWLQ